MSNNNQKQSANAYNRKYSGGDGNKGYDYHKIRLSKDGFTSDFFSKEAEEIAKDWVSEEDKNNKPGIKKSQLRKFFDEVKFISLKILNEEDFQTLKPRIMMLKAKVAYAVGRVADRENKSLNYYKRFQNFMNNCLDQIESKETFDNFVNLFECVYGFYYSYAPKE